jgi:hypothetical protein
MRTVWDPIMFTNQFYFKIQVKTLLADLSLKYMKNLLSIHWEIYSKIYANFYILRVNLKLLSNGRITWVACSCTWLKPILLLIWVCSKF